MSYINKTYGTNYKMGMRLLFCGQPVVICGTRGAYLRLKDEMGVVFLAHPTWRIEEASK